LIPLFPPKSPHAPRPARRFTSRESHVLKNLTILLSIAGLAIGLWAVATADERKPELPLARSASINPYARGVAALGVVEPAARTVSIVAPEPAMVMEVLVDVGDNVTQGMPLFRLDTRTIDARLLEATAALAGGEAQIARWHALPRAEDLPPLEAAVAAATALVHDREAQLSLTQQASQRGSGTDRDVSRAQFALEGAKADEARARAELARTRAGGWQPDLAVAQANLASLKAQVAALELLKDRLTVKAPAPGRILRRDIEPGEFAANDPNRPAFIIADLDHLHVRAQVDEEDIALISQAATKGIAAVRATARTRGAAVLDLPLELVRIEPFAHPKTDLMGTNSERVDTRVIDVVFRITRFLPLRSSLVRPSMSSSIRMACNIRRAVKASASSSRESRTEDEEYECKVGRGLV
jgi:HlyD family secretion protein